ncbi:MAG: hypothetical protein WCX97_01025 [Candidatus Magasanikbacteria bacterium]
MTLRQYLILMSLGTLICWGTWVFVILSLDPNSAGTLGLAFFYLSLFLALVGTFSVIVFLVRRAIVKNDEVIFRHVKKTFRQSVIFTTLIIFALFLLQEKLLTWWNGIILVVLFVILEAVIFTNRRYSNLEY